MPEAAASAAFIDAIKVGEFERVKAMVSADPTLIDACGRTGESAILTAVYHRQKEIVNLLVEGINEAKTKDIPVEIIYKEEDAIMHAYRNATPGTLITIMCDVVARALDKIRELKDREERGAVQSQLLASN